MNNLNTVLLNYLRSFGSKIIFTDHYKSYTGKEFLKKVLSYKSQLNLLWQNQEFKGLAIILDRDVDYISIIFATWLCGGFYVPLSTETSQSKNKNFISISKVNLIVYKKKKKLFFKKITNRKNIDFFKKNNLAYIIFTSGSTGEKKAVCISRENIFNYIKSIKKIFKNRYHPKSIIINGELTFDITLADFAFAFIFKSEIILTNSSKNLLSLLNLIKRRNVESIYLVPTTLKRLILLVKKLNLSFVSSVKQVNCGGEKLSVALINDTRKIFKDIKIYNFYGPTEFTVNSTFYALKNSKSLKEIPIGKVLPGVKYLIKKEKNSNRGELFLAGKQLMAGYLNYKNPFIKIKNKIYYPTGDIVKENKKREFFFICRNKDYIKYKGYRINLSSIEQEISKKLKLNIAVKMSKNQLILFVESRETKLIYNKIKKIINSKLEFYERPEKIYFKKKFPILSSGKIDIKKI